MEAERSLCLSETTHPNKEEVLLSQYNARMRLNFLVFSTNLNARVHVTSVCDQAAYEFSPPGEDESPMHHHHHHHH